MDNVISPHYDKLEEQFHTVNGLRTFSTVLGCGYDVVLVHGAGVSSRYWRNAQRQLATQGSFRVHALDFPGFGQSENPSWPPELARLAEHLEAWLDTLCLTKCALVGQSVGCEIAVLTATARAEQIERLVLAAPSGLPELESLPAQLFLAAADAPREALEVFRTVLPDYWRCGTARLLRMLREQVCCPAERYLPLLSQPTLVLRGKRDAVVSRRRVEAVARMIPCSRTTTVPGAHGAHITHAEAFAGAIALFLNSNEEEWCLPPGDSPDLPIAARERSPGVPEPG